MEIISCNFPQDGPCCERSQNDFQEANDSQHTLVAHSESKAGIKNIANSPHQVYGYNENARDILLNSFRG